jgi:rhodanese-related sulfurtransferase
LARVGYDYAIGYLKGGIDSWKEAGKETDSIKSIKIDEFVSAYQGDKNINILDVRKASEFYAEHIVDAENAPLDYINESMLKIDKNKTYYVHCAGGYRSMIFASVLKARGYNNLINVEGGFTSIKNSNAFPVTEYVCPSTML